MGWERYVGPFGRWSAWRAASGLRRPVKVVMEKLGFTAQNVADKALEVKDAVAARLGRHGPAPGLTPP